MIFLSMKGWIWRYFLVCSMSWNLSLKFCLGGVEHYSARAAGRYRKEKRRGWLLGGEKWVKLRGFTIHTWFRPADSGRHDSGRTIQAGRLRPDTIQACHDSGRSRFRPILIQAKNARFRPDMTQAPRLRPDMIQASHDSGRYDSGPSLFRPSKHDSGQIDTIQAKHHSGRTQFRPVMIQASHDSGQTRFRPDIIQAHLFSLKYCPSYLTEPNQFYARLRLTPAESNRRVWMYAGFIYVFQSWFRLIEVWLG